MTEPPQPPIVGAAQWLAVMEKAKYMCRCVNSCGTTHKGGYCGKDGLF